jgi:protein involved in polysaccharide export with SLBB domain
MRLLNSCNRIVRQSALAACRFVFPTRAAGQQASGRATALATRASLQAELAQLGAGDAQAALIRTRLEKGDFQAGDRIFLRVDGEQQLTDTFTVGDNLEVALPQVGSVSLRGALRSELDDRLTTYLSQYLRTPVVEARPLMRLLVEGQVGRPGFYTTAPELPLADVIVVAGGLTQTAKTGEIRIQRGESIILGGATLQHALGAGYSLDRLNLQAGDRLYVPARGDSERTLRIVGVLLSIPLAIFALRKAF